MLKAPTIASLLLIAGSSPLLGGHGPAEARYHGPGGPSVANALAAMPSIGFSTFLGGMASEDLPRIAIDGDGNIYVVGTTASPDFPAQVVVEGGAPAHAALIGDVDVFVAKLDASGTSVIYATYVGGSSMDMGMAIAVDDAGRAYVTGQTTSVDFPTAGGVQQAYGGTTDAFVARITADGTAVDYSTLLGGSGIEAGSGIAVGVDGAVYVTGQTGSPDFPTIGAANPGLGGTTDAFVAKIDTRASQLVYSTYLGSESADDTGFAIAVDDAGHAYVVGNTDGADFPRVNAAQRAFGGRRDAFAVRLGADGELLYATTLGGSGTDAALAVDVDRDGNAYFTGQTDSPDFPTRRALQNEAGGGPDAYVAKLDAQGAVVYATYLGGSDVDVGGGIAVDGSGNAHVTGMTASADFPTADSLQPFLGGGADLFVSRVNDLGSGLTYSTYFGGVGAEAGTGIVVDGAGNAYVAGQTGSPDYPTYNPVQAGLAGPQDVFVTKFCLSLIFPAQGAFDSSGGAGRVEVTTPAGCAWLADSEENWIAVTARSTVAGSGTVEFALAPNGTGAPRTGTITIGGAPFSVAQAAAAECVYLLSKYSENFYGEAGGVGRVRVITTPDCRWTARTREDWVSVITSEVNVGEGTVSFNVRGNSTGRQRAGVIEIAGYSFVVFSWIR